jgi:hypothetical protein
MKKQKTDDECIVKGKEYYKGRQDARAEILKFIEDERDNGNCEPFSITENKCFSPSLCLSKLIKLLEQ